jgi:diacylglycerol kinase (ATP)
VADFSIATRESPALIFVNPRAGRGRGRKYLPAIQKIFADRSVPAEFVFSESTEELGSLARAAIQTGHRLLIAMGGDGTLQGLVNATYGADVVLGIIPVGGGNDFAAALDFPRDPARATALMLSGKPRKVDLLCASTADGGRRLYVGGGGIGLDAAAAVYASGTYARLPGRSRYLAAAVHALSKFKALHIRAEFPGSDLPIVEARVLIAGALNTPTYGAGLRLAPDARVDDGLVTTIFVKDLSAGKILGILPRLLVRGDLAESYITRVTAPRVRLNADRDCLFHADGEIVGPAPIEIEVLPRAAKILAPSF